MEKSRKTSATSTRGLMIMNRLASALEQLLSAQPSTKHPEFFKALDFTGKSGVEGFIQQFQKVTTANGWLKMAALLHICTHLEDDACVWRSYAILMEELEAL